jgi:uncharacterized protein (TIGR02266 family)
LAEQFRRTDPRYDRRLEVEIAASGESHIGLSRNISLGGMFVELPAMLPLGSAIQVRFSVPTQSEPIEVTGEVRWVERAAAGQGFGLGIRFHGLRARDVWALNRFFQS